MPRTAFRRASPPDYVYALGPGPAGVLHFASPDFRAPALLGRSPDPPFFARGTFFTAVTHPGCRFSAGVPTVSVLLHGRLVSSYPHDARPGFMMDSGRAVAARLPPVFSLAAISSCTPPPSRCPSASRIKAGPGREAAGESPRTQVDRRRRVLETPPSRVDYRAARPRLLQTSSLRTKADPRPAATSPRCVPRTGFGCGAAFSRRCAPNMPSAEVQPHLPRVCSGLTPTAGIWPSSAL